MYNVLPMPVVCRQWTFTSTALVPLEMSSDLLLNMHSCLHALQVYEYLVSQAGTLLKSREQLKELLKDLKVQQ
jgi:hypothetical protein